MVQEGTGKARQREIFGAKFNKCCSNSLEGCKILLVWRSLGNEEVASASEDKRLSARPQAVNGRRMPEHLSCLGMLRGEAGFGGSGREGGRMGPWGQSGGAGGACVTAGW